MVGPKVSEAKGSKPSEFRMVFLGSASRFWGA
jgi:hypothetical protein